MAGPSLDWLQQAQAALQNGAPVPPTAQPVMLGGVDVNQPPPAAPLTPAAIPPAPGMISLGGMPPQAPPAPPAPPPQPAPPDAAQAVPASLEAQGPAPMPPDVQFRPVGGGTVKAREMDIRGPRQNALLEQSFTHPQEALGDAMQRTNAQVATATQVYEQQAEDALNRRAVAEQSLARRQDEMRQLQADYRNTISQIGQQHLDGGRWFAKKSTGGKIESIVLGIISGLTAAGNAYGHGNGQNLAWDYLMREIDMDVEDQKLERQLKERGAQNAYSMALDRYQSEDAASAAARAAALDVVEAHGRKLASQWGGVETLNRFAMLQSQVQAERDQTMAAGLKFIPAHAAPGKYQMMVRGQVIPGLVGEKEAQRIALEHGVKPSERVDEKMVEGGIQATIKAQDAAMKHGEKADEGAKFIAEKLQSAGVPQARAAAEAALAALNKSPGGKAESAARWALGKSPVLGDSLPNAVMSQDSNAREQAYWAFANASMKAMMGNVTAGEFERAEKQLGSAHDPESRKRAIAATLETLAEVEKSVKAGVSPEAQRTFDERRESATGGKPAAPPGAKKGW